MGGSLARALVVIAAFGVIVGCGASGKPSGRLARFSDSQIEFTYPAGWRAQYQGQGLSLESNIIVALSTVRLRSPCRRLSANSGECGLFLMVKRLPPGGVFVVWTEGGFNVPPLAGQSGVSTTVGGRAAKLSFDRHAGDYCGKLGQTQAVNAQILGSVQMVACARDNKVFRAQITEMLKHVRFKTQ